jgi:hypothetical protein
MPQTMTNNMTCDDSMIPKEYNSFSLLASADRCHLAKRFGSPHWIPFYTFLLRLCIKSRLSLAQFHDTDGADDYEHQQSLAFCRKEVEVWERMFGSQH